MKNIPLGLYSCVVAALVCVGSSGGIAVVLQNQLFFFKHKTGNLLLSVGVLTSLGMALLGAGLSIGGLMQANRRKALAVLGLVSNGLFLLGVLGLFAVGAIGFSSHPPRPPPKTAPVEREWKPDQPPQPNRSVKDGLRGQESSPPPEMKALEKLVGTWRVEHVGKVPEKAPFTCIIKARLVLGGRFVQQTWDVAPGEPDQIGVYTYDSNRRTYRYWFFHSSGYFVDSTGTWNESSQVFTFTNRPYQGATGVITSHFLDEATYDWSIVNKGARGEVVYHMEGKAVRQK